MAQGVNLKHSINRITSKMIFIFKNAISFFTILLLLKIKHYVKSRREKNTNHQI